MDTKQILLEKNRSKISVNDNNFINLDLENKARLLPFNNISDTLNLNQLYNDERDNCEKYRMIFTVNPICSNVLFNTKTEVVRYEGSDECEVLLDDSHGTSDNAINTSALNLKQAIKDTEYSHPEVFDNNIPYVYHCGVDIFNNHILRNNDFVYVNKITSRTPIVDKTVFNTIKDLVRNNDGNNVQEDVTPGFTGQTKKDIHLYQYDTVLTMYDAFTNRLKVKDGWYGFNNSTNIAIPNAKINEKDVSINRVMNNNKSCEFIDLYPDRSLYSFIPKVNKYRRRLEKNWDYCITYPKSKDSEQVSIVCGVPTGITENNGGASIKIVEAKRAYSNSGNNVVRMKTMFRHTFKPGDYITLFYIDKDNENNLLHFNNRIRVISVGDYEGLNKDRYFTIQFKDISSRFDFVEEGFVGNEEIQENDIVFKDSFKKAKFFFKKNVSGVDCQYYFRKFAKITKNNDGVTDLTSEINKLAYGENIYGDRIAQIVFTDDIDVEGLVDHRGRPLTEVYLTVVKRNAGHNEWYNGNYRSANIEFSHCFGEVTTGIDLPEEEFNYNVRKLNNINFRSIAGYEDLFSKELYASGSPKTIDSDINISSYNGNGIYADIVEYDSVSDYEQVMDIVYHRFNTAQREIVDSRYANIWYDELVSDDYDYSTENTSLPDSKLAGFKVNEVNLSKSSYVDSSVNPAIIVSKDIPGNINPEGYFYNPYTKIKIKELSENISKVIGKQIKFGSVENKRLVLDGVVYYGFIIRNTSMDYNIIKNDILAIYNNEVKDISWGTVYEVSNNGKDIWVLCDNINIVRHIDNYSIIKIDEGIPPYATYLPSSHSFVWRSIVPMSELPVDSDINDMPFSNGRNYIEKNVNFYLKRQDPTGMFGLLNFDENAKYKSNLTMYRVNGWDPIDLSSDLYNNGDLGSICL